jgi:putative methyltransferase (TIGR04325 family)
MSSRARTLGFQTFALVLRGVTVTRVFLRKVVRRLWRASRSALVRPPRGWLYPSFDAALAECDGGYESTAIASVVCRKTARMLAEDVLEVSPDGILLAAAALAGCRSPIKVVDVGGAAGAHYLAVRRLLSSSILLEWIVVETTAMVDVAHRLYNGHEIKFETSFAKALSRLSGRPDLLLASGVLMCLPSPMDALSSFVASGAEAIVLTRTGLSPDGQTRIIIQESRLAQNGPGELPEGVDDALVRYPNTFVPQAACEALLQSRYEIRLRKVETVHAWSAGGVPISQFAYLALRRPKDIPGSEKNDGRS